MQSRKKQLIKSLNLKPHPEGGYFSETYRSNGTIKQKSGEFPDGRNFSTAIYFLLGSEDISMFHRIKSDEVWHHYEGSSLTIHVIHQDGSCQKFRLGKDYENSQQPQHVIPAGAWFGVTVDQSDSFALCGCTVSPGFDFQDFEMADRSSLLEKFPEHEAIINQLTVSS
ncbi:MAG: cupin domain-containing protein [Balneolaceae bacterium]|nr:cupin domain-containing protein [Balneolaceae bacterium]